MITLGGFFTIFPSVSKRFFFTRNVFFLDSWVLFILPLFFLVYFLLIENFIIFSSKIKLTFSVIFSFILLILLICFSVSDPFLFLVRFEITALWFVLLIVIFSKDFDKISSSFFIFFFNIFCSIPFIIFCSEYSKISFCYQSIEIECIFRFLIFFRFFSILAFKLPLFILHFWLTKAHVASFGVGSMVLARVTLKIGTLGFFKFVKKFSLFNLESSFYAFSLWTFLLLTIFMLRYLDSKYLIACSSIMHMSLSFPLFYSFSRFRIISCIFIAVGHGVVSYYLFYLVSLFYESNKARSLDFLKGVESWDSFFCIIFCIFLVLNLGLPPFISFLTELYSLRIILKFRWILGFLFFFSFFFSVFFTIFLIMKIVFGKKFFYSSVTSRVNLNFNSFFFIRSFFFYPFLFFCYFSLFKTSLCGSGDFDGNSSEKIRNFFFKWFYYIFFFSYQPVKFL